MIYRVLYGLWLTGILCKALRLLIDAKAANVCKASLWKLIQNDNLGEHSVRIGQTKESSN